MEQLSRIFVAISPPPEIRMAMGERLASLSVPGRVSPALNWHLTLRFLGQLPQPTYERFLASLSVRRLGSAFKVGLGRLGAFPEKRKATVLWVGVSKGQERLTDLAAECEDAAQAAGVAPEERPFRPHLSVSRIRPPQDVSSLIRTTRDLDLEWRCDELVIYQSHLGSGHPTYQPLDRIPLGR